MSSPYPLLENDEYTYEFVTDQGIRYLIFFIDYSALFEAWPEISPYVYMFNIDVIDGDPDNGVTDERIGVTVLQVFNTFFSKVRNIAVYICDSTDERHLARKRKFDFWFWKYNNGKLLKEDGMAVVDGQIIYNAMLLHKENEHLTDIILAYKELNERSSSK